MRDAADSVSGVARNPALFGLAWRAAITAGSFFAILGLSHPVDAQPKSAPVIASPAPPAAQSEPLPDHGPAGASQSAADKAAKPASEARPTEFAEQRGARAIWLVLGGIICFAAGTIAGAVAVHRGLLGAFGISARNAVAVNPAADSSVAATPGASDAFRHQYRDFRDIYGAIWRAAEGEEETDDERSRLFARWDERVKRVGQPPLLEAWMRASALGGTQQAARAWIAALRAWGITTEYPDLLQVNADALARFDIFPEAASGTARVAEPCWLFNGTVLAKGYAVPIAR